MYQYTDCFLDNIWLTNGYTVRTSDDGDYAEIEDEAGLHELMMNMEVGSILNLGQPFYFEYTPEGWKLITQEASVRKIA